MAVLPWAAGQLVGLVFSILVTSPIVMAGQAGQALTESVMRMSWEASWPLVLRMDHQIQSTKERLGETVVKVLSGLVLKRSGLAYVWEGEMDGGERKMITTGKHQLADCEMITDEAGEESPTLEEIESEETVTENYVKAKINWFLPRSET